MGLAAGDLLNVPCDGKLLVPPVFSFGEADEVSMLFGGSFRSSSVKLPSISCETRKR